MDGFGFTLILELRELAAGRRGSALDRWASALSLPGERETA
jgi:hypothetical protein